MAKSNTQPGNTEKQGSGRLTVTLKKSTIGFNKTQAKTVEGLGLRRLNHTVELADTAETRGMIHKVRHLVVVE